VKCPVTLGRREARKLDRRDAIVDAARQSFLEYGYAGTSMSGLLNTLGGSKATLWSYFRSKEELFAAVVEQLSASFRSELDGSLTVSGDLTVTLTTFCGRFLRAIQTPDAVATWRLVMAESSRFPEVGRIFYERAASHTERLLVDFLRLRIESGELVAKDPVRMARNLYSLCAGRQTRMLLGVEIAGPNAIEADAAEYADIFLSAYRRPRN
jgi:AcrR family transcriptional regulator